MDFEDLRVRHIQYMQEDQSGFRFKKYEKMVNRLSGRIMKMCGSLKMRIQLKNHVMLITHDLLKRNIYHVTRRNKSHFMCLVILTRACLMIGFPLEKRDLLKFSAKESDLDDIWNWGMNTLIT